MPRVPITNLDDPAIAIYRDLKHTNLTRNLDQFVVEGEKLFGRLLESRFPLVSVLCSDRHEQEVAARVPEGVPWYVVPRERISAVVGFPFHRGVLACAERRPWPDLERVARTLGTEATLVVCPRLENPDNLGTITRIADVFGADAILVGGRCPDVFSRRVLRVSMGTALRLPVLSRADLERDVEQLRASEGFVLAATVVDAAAEPIGTFRRPARLALFLGAEGDGLGPEWVERCDRRLTIPMRPGAESLNVGVAAGIFLHHLMAPAATRSHPA